MELLKIILLIVAYSLGISTLILQFVCYLKELEYRETIFFSISFLLLILATTIQSVVHTQDFKILQTMELVVHILTIIFALAIPINIHKERLDTNRRFKNTIAIVMGAVFIITSIPTYFFYPTIVLITASFLLCLSVIYSMLYILFSKPVLLIRFREKTERKVAVFILIIMMVSLGFLIIKIDLTSISEMQNYGGIILAIVCIILSVSKIPDDIKKLVQNESFADINESKINAIGLTPREFEVMQLLITGKTYKEIAAELFVSLPTIKSHVSNIYSKAQVRNRLELSNLIKRLNAST